MRKKARRRRRRRGCSQGCPASLNVPMATDVPQEKQPINVRPACGERCVFHVFVTNRGKFKHC